ncbi:MAG: HAMP domain-containing methyl-accepting chemotaxis protein [Deltaproteobacteria bacterium]|nr:HAMP domain-containing methyl-accepting chemotaxis protein [Deltaproteobacteria bacterium]
MSLTSSFRRRGLRANLILWFSGLLVLLFVTTGLALGTVISSALTDSLDRRARSTLAMLANRSELALLQADRDEAAAIVTETLEDPDVAYVALLGPKGEKVLASRFRDEWRDHATSVLVARRSNLQRLHFEDDHFMHYGVEVKSHSLAAAPADGVDNTGEDFLLGDSFIDELAEPKAGGDVVEESLGFVVLGMSRSGLEDSLTKVGKLMFGLLVAGIVVYLLAAFAISRVFIMAPIGVMKRAATRMSEFDLTGRTERMADDELGELSDALNGIAENLHGVLGRVQGVTDSLGTVAERVSRTSQVVAQGSASTAASVDQTSSSMSQMLVSLKGIGENVETLAQSAEESSSSILEMAATNDEVTSNIGSLAASVEETTTAIEQMTYSIKEVARNVEDLSATAEETSSAMNEMDVSISQVEMNANETARLSEQVSSDARGAGEALGATIEGIDNIRESSRVAADVIEALGDKIAKIGSILEVIDEVADQTNLLALNAAIIAAQAGEHGKGFAVVAEEIKDLAERTGSSTKEIADLISSVQDESHNAISAMERGVKRVDEGVRLAGEADLALRQILDSASKSTQMVKAIARATVEQSRGSKQVTGAISRIAETVQEIARATAEQARGSEQIMRSAERMKIITKHVERSSQEQARGSKQITQAIESISDMVQRLNAAQKEQTKGAEQVMLAVDNIKEATDRQGTAVKDLELTIDTLSEQSEVLRTEVQRFRT